MWICSKCGEQIEDEFDTCWKCSTPKEGTQPLKEEKMVLSDGNNETSKIIDKSRSQIPWERRKEIGRSKAFWQTLKIVALEPGKFFDDLAGRDGSSDAFWFYFSFNMVIIIILLFAQVPVPLMVMRNVPSSLSAMLLYYFVMAIILIPIGLAAGIYIISAVMHLFVILFRGKGSFDDTLTIMAYSQPVLELFVLILAISQTAAIISTKFIHSPKISGHIFYLLIVGLIWPAVIVVKGLRRFHKLDSFRAACLFLVLLIILISLQLGMVFVLTIGYGRYTLTSDTLNRSQEIENRNNLEQFLQREQEQTRIKSEISFIHLNMNLHFFLNCIDSYYRGHKAYPSSLEELDAAYKGGFGSIGAKLDAKSSSAIIEGSSYIYHASDKDHFTLYARPTPPETPQDKGLFVDQTGVIRLDGPSGLPYEQEEKNKLETKEKESFEWAIKTLKNNNAQQKLLALQMLLIRKDPRARQPLIELLSDPSINVRCGAIRALGPIANEAVKEKLIILTKDKNEYIRASAVRALGNIKR